MGEMRLQKYLADAGIASRRKAEQMISQGRVTVNGLLVKEMGVKVSEDCIVEVDGKKVDMTKGCIYIMLHKPVGYIATVEDQFSRPTVIDLVKDVKERIYPVGRLDYDTSGLILLTNDGAFTYRLTHPKHEVEKTYIVEVEGIPGDEVNNLFKKGLKIDDYITAPAQLKILEKKENKNKAVLEIKIHEGRNRQVRKMCEAIGHPVKHLKRVAIGGLRLGNLEEGKWRYLTEKELRFLDK